MRIALFTGELSGELYAFHLLKRLESSLSGSLEVLGIGGPHTLELPFFKSIADISELSIMGVLDVFLNLRRLLNLFKDCLKEIKRFSPHLVLLIDSPDFNLRMAKALRESGFTGKIVYFIPPTAWIWRSGRADLIKRYCDLVITLFDFEAEWYSFRGVRAYFLGHPLLDILPEKVEGALKGEFKRPLLGCFPGSRKREVEYLLPVMLEVSYAWKGDVVFSKVKNLPGKLYEGVHNLYELPSYQLLSSCDYVLAASGTIAVEALIYEKPTVIIYKANLLNYLLYKLLVNAPFVSMPNIMSKEELYPELLQWDANPKKILKKFEVWLNDEGKLEEMKFKMRRLKERLGKRGALDRIASVILNEIASSG